MWFTRYLFWNINHVIVIHCLIYSFWRIVHLWVIHKYYQILITVYNCFVWIIRCYSLVNISNIPRSIQGRWGAAQYRLRVFPYVILAYRHPTSALSIANLSQISAIKSLLYITILYNNNQQYHAIIRIVLDLNSRVWIIVTSSTSFHLVIFYNSYAHLNR